MPHNVTQTSLPWYKVGHNVPALLLVKGESYPVLLKFPVIQTRNNRSIWAEKSFDSCRSFSCVGNYPLCIYVIRKVSFICLWLSEASNKKHIHSPIPSSSQQHRKRENIINTYVIVRLREYIPCQLGITSTNWNFSQHFTLPTLNSHQARPTFIWIHADQCTRNYTEI